MPISPFPPQLRRSEIDSSLPTIGVHVNPGLKRTNRTFTLDLLHTINESGRYRAVQLNLLTLLLESAYEAYRFCVANNLLLIIQNDDWHFSSNQRYRTNVSLLERYCLIVNSTSCNEIAHNKFIASQVLTSFGIPTTKSRLIHSSQELHQALTEGNLFVIKPAIGGGGEGVRLITIKRRRFYEYFNKIWIRLNVSSVKTGSQQYLAVRRIGWPPSVVLLFTLLSLMMSLVQQPLIEFLGGLSGLLSIIWFTKYTDNGYQYNHGAVLEPYFNDDPDGFASLRCTIIGDKVVESVKRVNRTNITSNVSRGGQARYHCLSDFQIRIAVDAAKAIGADYCGVDLLVYGDDTIVGEVNTGPIMMYTEYTGVSVGKALGNYLITKCDLFASVDDNSESVL